MDSDAIFTNAAPDQFERKRSRPVCSRFEIVSPYPQYPAAQCATPENVNRAIFLAGPYFQSGSSIGAYGRAAAGNAARDLASNRIENGNRTCIGRWPPP